VVNPVVSTRRRNAAFLVAIVIFALAAAIFFGRRRPVPILSTQNNVLRIYTYSSFSNSWGAGPELIRIFQEHSGTQVDLIDVGDSRMILNRMRLEGKRLAADLIVGLDQYAVEEAQSLNNFETLTDVIQKVRWNPKLPEEARAKDSFIPFDWAPLSYVYRVSEKQGPTSISDLKLPAWKQSWVAIDPGTSTVGYQWIAWVAGIFGTAHVKAELQALRPSIKTVAPSWSGAYGLFQKKNADLAFSQITSVIYHRVEEKNEDFQWARLKEPHPYQVEFAGIPRTCVACKEAYDFVDFLVSPEAQTVLMKKNYMLPVVDGVVSGTEFESLEIPNLTALKATAMAPSELLEIWKDSIQ
jgi:thiamine transport system substrate-binding protein